VEAAKERFQGSGGYIDVG